MPDRPDLTGLDPAILAYIEALESELASRSGRRESAAESFDPAEAPTTLNVITISAAGIAKRTPRHLYTRQRRGGMGVFDLDVSDSDAPALLTVADESAAILLLSSRGRAFRLAVETLPESPVRSKGIDLPARLGLTAGEQIVRALPADGGPYLIVVTERGQVQRLSANYFGSAMRPGTVFYDTKDGGAPAAACWSAGNADLFIATRSGQAIRFAEKLVPVRGCLGIRLERNDRVAGVAAVYEHTGVFLLSSDGRGTIRAMNGFGANKAPGSGGKVAMKADALIGAVAVDENDDLFVISRLSKIIRFAAAEVPAKEGVVQGVNCMELRADETVALAASNL